MVLLCFGQVAPLWASVSSLIELSAVWLSVYRESLCSVSAGREKWAHSGDRWDAEARCQTRNLSRNRGLEASTQQLPSLQSQAQLPPKAP